MPKSNAPPPSYNDLNSELQTIIADMQQNDLDIDKTIVMYERGMQIIQQLTEYLEKAENKIEDLKLSFPNE